MTTLSVEDLIVEVRDVNAQVLGRIDSGFLNGAVLPARVNDVTAWALTLPEKVNGVLFEPTVWLRSPGSGIVVRIGGTDGTFLSGPMVTATRTVSAFGVVSWQFRGVSDETILAGAVAARNPALPLNAQYQQQPVPVTGDAAAVLTQLVSRNVGPDAHATRRNGLRARLRVSNTASSSANITVHPVGENLLALLQEWSKDRPFQWRMLCNRADGLIYFTVRTTLDRTDDVLFDVALDTVSEETTTARAPEATTVIGVGGVGEAVASDADSVAAWGVPREVTVDQPSVTDVNQLSAIALQQLEAGKPSEGFAVVPRDDVAAPGMLGSVVKVNVNGTPYLARLNEVLITVTDGSVHVTATIGNTDGTDWEGTVDAGLARLAERVSQLESAPKTAELNRVPVAPTGLDVQSSSFTTTLGIPQARVTVACTAPQAGTDTLPLALQGIELWGAKQGETMRRLTSAPSSPIVFDPLPVGETWQFKVRSISTNGKVSAFSNTATVTLTKDTTPPPAPSTPVLSSALGVVTVKFDGKTNSGGAQPADYSHTAVVIAGEEVARIDPTTGVSTAHLTGLTGSVTVRLRSYDTSGNPSALSAPATTTVKSVLDDTNIANLAAELADAQTQIDNALSLAEAANTTATTADGRLTVSPNAPTTADGAGKPSGAVWFQRTGSGLFTGSWEWTGSGWASRKFDNAVLESLDAAKINTGYLDVANRVRANTITAEKLIVAGPGNLLPNGSFEYGLADWSPASLAGAEVVQVSDGPDGRTTNVLRLAPAGSDQGVTSAAFPISGGPAYEPGVRYRFRMRVRLVSGNAGLCRIRLGLFGTGQSNQWPLVGAGLNATTATRGDWTWVEGEYETPVGNPRDRMAVQIHLSNAVGTVFEVSDVSMRQMISAELLVDGAVIARTITASEELSAKVGQFLTLDVGKLRAGSGTFDTAVAGLMRTTVLIANAITAESGVLASASVTTAAIANLAVTNAKIADLDVGKLRAGSGTFDTAVANLMRTTVLIANSVTAANMTVTPANLIDDPGFDTPLGGGSWSVRSGPVVYDRNNNVPGKGVRFNGEGRLDGSYRFAVTGGEKFLLAARVYTNAASSGRLWIGWNDADGQYIGSSSLNVPANGGWRDMSVEVSAPANAVNGYFVAAANEGTTSNGFWFAKPRIVRKTTAELIVEGAVRAEHLTVDQAFINKLFVNDLLVNALTGKTISGAMINGGTIVGGMISGAVIRTAASGARMSMYSGPALDMYDVNNKWRGTLQMGASGDSPMFLLKDANETTRAAILDTSAIWADVSGRVRVRLDSDGAHWWDTAGRERVRLSSAGAYWFNTQGVADGQIVSTSDNNQGITIWGGNSYTSQWARLELSGIDGTGRWLTQGIYTNTVGSASNVHLSSAGILYRSTSLRKAKLDIRDEPAGYDLLNIPLRSWIDRKQLEEAVVGEAPYPERRGLGVIAEEVEAIFPALATYTDDGELNGVAYDRFGPALIPLLRDLVNRVEELEGKQPTGWPTSPDYDDTELIAAVTAKGALPLRERIHGDQSPPEVETHDEPVQGEPAAPVGDA